MPFRIGPECFCRGFTEYTNAEQAIDTGLAGRSPDITVQGFAGIAEFTHITQYQPSGRGHAGKKSDRGTDGSRIRVVAIVVDRDAAADLKWPQTAGDVYHSFEAVSDRAYGRARGLCRCGGGQHVLYVVTPGNRDA